jgi:hypothetical protein
MISVQAVHTKQAKKVTTNAMILTAIIINIAMAKTVKITNKMLSIKKIIIYKGYCNE